MIDLLSILNARVYIYIISLVITVYQFNNLRYYVRHNHTIIARCFYYATDFNFWNLRKFKKSCLYI